MLDNDGFDLWADGYDRDVGISESENTYPFAGYKKVLSSIFRTVTETPSPDVLDIGFGTGVLTAKLYEAGCNVYGEDFSPKMIEKASLRMPYAHLYQGDFSSGLAEPLKTRSYDYIIATYSLHHLEDDKKISFIKQLLGYLKDNGSILIGDVAFETRTELEKCKEDFSDVWDEDEIYFVADEIKAAFPRLHFEKISCCAGILTLKRD